MREMEEEVNRYMMTGGVSEIKSGGREEELGFLSCSE